VKEAWAAKVMIAKVSMRVRRVAVRTELAVSTARAALAREWKEER
jgi:cytidylate kinase